MIILSCKVEVAPEHQAEYEALCDGLAAKVRANEPGVVYYAQAKSKTEPNTYISIEVYQDEAVQAAHAQTPYLLEAMGKISPLVLNGFQVELYDTI